MMLGGGEAASKMRPPLPQPPPSSNGLSSNGNSVSVSVSVVSDVNELCPICKLVPQEPNPNSHINLHHYRQINQVLLTHNKYD